MKNTDYSSLTSAPTSESAPPPWERIRNVLLELPVREKGLANWHTLRFICRHLYCVSEKSEINKMSCRNLATCLCPTFFPLKDPSKFFCLIQETDK